MKKTLFFLSSLFLLHAGKAQLVAKTKCADFVVDIFDGKVNGLKASAPIYDIKKQFPCFTRVEEEGTKDKCGAAVYYKDRDLTFYTDRDYVEIGPKFKGKLTVPVMGAKRSSMFNWFGNPKIKDDKWEAFQTSFGTIVLYYDAANKVNRIRFSTNSTDTMSICE